MAAGIVLDDDDRILVTRRRADVPLGGLWEFPGGKVEPGETLEEALVRELTEELGIVARPSARWGTLTHAYADHEVRLHFLFARIVSGTPHPHEAEELLWASPPELQELEFPEADETLLQDLVRCHREGQPLETSRQR